MRKSHGYSDIPATSLGPRSLSALVRVGIAARRSPPADDNKAIEAVRRISSASIGAGFEIWADDRLVHRHRNRDARTGRPRQALAGKRRAS